MSAGMLMTGDECRRCYGTGWDARTPEPCYHCHGTGRELTALGDELVELLVELFDLKPKAQA